MGRRKKMPVEVARVVGDRAGGRCEAMVFPVCTGGAEQLHHRQYRSRGGEHTVTNLVFICKACHDCVHAHPRESAEIGLSVHSGQEPGDVPVHYRGRPAVLDDAGGVTYSIMEE